MAGISVIVEDLKHHPKCAHGPTILFSRPFDTNGTRRNFFACSACRDRKLCSYFMWQDEWQRQNQQTTNALTLLAKEYTKNINHHKLFLQLNEIKCMPENGRIYCIDCSELVPSKYKQKHESHKLKLGVSDHELDHPSEFLMPLDNSKKEAQYLFSKSSVAVIVDILNKLNLRNILCIGAPRIHEHIRNNCQSSSSFLLDFDKRYLSFFGPLEICWYNMFNHHFFLESSEETYQSFLQNDGGKYFAIVTDPPFGGRVELIANTLKIIQKEYQTINETDGELPIFLIFPYFMEPQILNSLPEFKMLDYKVDYENHPLFQDNSKGRKFGSPVRIFTNIDVSKIKLPKKEGYKPCKICKRWVYAENVHCEKCNSCTSKDGRTYTHCDVCERCVKPSWAHCAKCERCAQPDHKCGIIPFTQECFHCKQTGHKKRDCPKVDQSELQKKRKTKHKMSKEKKKKKLK